MSHQEQIKEITKDLKISKELRTCAEFIGIEITNVVITSNITGTLVEFHIDSMLVSFKMYGYQNFRQVIVKKLSEYIIT